MPIGLCLCLGAIVYIAASGNPLLFNNYPLQLFGGVDSYGLKPLGLSPFELLEWALINDAEGVQFSETGLPPSKTPAPLLLAWLSCRTNSLTAMIDATLRELGQFLKDEKILV